ncbi:MAG: hypothetical protein H0Z37_05970, partial [Firmicutes bacterium]|nr:hypothetical protein [Bacillota bacterium]
GWGENNAHRVGVVAGADQCNSPLPRPGGAVAAEIGPARAQAFVPIARSNAVITPPGGPTGDLAQWLLSPGERAVSIPAAPALRVDAELVVFGRVSDPRTRVLVGGQPVEVGADGSFRFRCSLPDGTIVVPVEACFSDGARRAVTPVVSRETY